MIQTCCSYRVLSLSTDCGDRLGRAVTTLHGKRPGPAYHRPRPLQLPDSMIAVALTVAPPGGPALTGWKRTELTHDSLLGLQARPCAGPLTTTLEATAVYSLSVPCPCPRWAVALTKCGRGKPEWSGDQMAEGEFGEGRRKLSFGSASTPSSSDCAGGFE